MSKRTRRDPNNLNPHDNGGGRPPKLDYDADEVYDVIYSLAFNGAGDREIPLLLVDELGTSISVELFGKWKTGTYDKWTNEENARRSARLVRVLERARGKMVTALKNTYLKMALGRIKTKNKGKVSKHLVINGQQTEDELVQTTENEIEYAPSLQAISMLLYHYDPEWRKVTNKVKEDEDGIPRNIDHGVGIDEWIKREMTDGSGDNNS